MPFALLRRVLYPLAVASIWLLVGIPDASGGPPLTVDDTETLDRGQFELFTGFSYAKAGSRRAYDTPTELTIGLAKGWECSIRGSYQYFHDGSATPNTVNGILSLQIGTKLRVLTESPTVPVSLALSGTLTFPTSSNAKYAAQGKPAGGVFLIAGRGFGDFTINANVGYAIGGAQKRNAANDAWFFGLTAQRIFAKKYTIFAEAFATPQVGRFREAVINADGGLLWDLSDRFRITVLLGRGFRPGGAEFVGNIGFLVSLGPKPVAEKEVK